MPNRIICYRAVVEDVSVDNHPIQNISMNMLDIHDWAHKYADHYKKNVKIYVQREFVFKLVRPTSIRARETKIEDKKFETQACVCGIHVTCPLHPLKSK